MSEEELEPEVEVAVDTAYQFVSLKSAVEPGKKYESIREKELDELADQYLRDDIKNNDSHLMTGDNPILFFEHVKSRWRREVQTGEGIPDPHLSIDGGKPGAKTNNQPGLYNRTHPRGRKVNSEEQRRRHGASFYR